MIHTAVRVLHALHPIELPLHLVEEIRHAVSGLGQIPIVVRPSRGVEIEAVDEVLDCLRCGHDILTIVARIVPPAVHVHRRLTVDDLAIVQRRVEHVRCEDRVHAMAVVVRAVVLVALGSGVAG